MWKIAVKIKSRNSASCLSGHYIWVHLPHNTKKNVLDTKLQTHHDFCHHQGRVGAI